VSKRLTNLKTERPYSKPSYTKPRKQTRPRRFHALHDKLYLPYILQKCVGRWFRRKRRRCGVFDEQSIKDIETYGVERFFLTETGASPCGKKTYSPGCVCDVCSYPRGDGRLRPLGNTYGCVTVSFRLAAKLVLEPIFEADFEGCFFRFSVLGSGQLDALASVTDHSQARVPMGGGCRHRAVSSTTSTHEKLMSALRRRIGDGEIATV